MNIDTVISIARDALYCIVITSAPCLLVSLVIGLVVSIFQTVTSIQEQTMTFVPKIVGIFLAIMLLGHWMLNNMVTFMTDLLNNIPNYIK
ncbi:MAG: flagellar biosynthesis protein FliQ [Lachnospiraceae bacterium]|nr:flagellar biosynthesis protein FliQ [Lachnospiraceae bacterium]